MSIDVHKDTVINVPGVEPGSEAKRSLEIREGSRGNLEIHTGEHGREVTIDDLESACKIARHEFGQPLPKEFGPATWEGSV